MFKKLQQALFGAPPKPSPPPGAPSPSHHPGELTDATFGAQALACGPLTVVDFWADWCQPCQVMSAHVEMLAREYGNRLRVFALDVDENPISADRFSIMGLPTLLLFRDGVEVERIVGVGPYESLRRTVDRLLADSAPAAEVAPPTHPPAPPAQSADV